MQSQTIFKVRLEDASSEERIRGARLLATRDIRSAFAQLNEIFRGGIAPSPLPNGRYAGELVALDLFPGLTQFGRFISARWLPWKGKFFDAENSRGDNILTSDSIGLMKVMSPFYRGYRQDGRETYRAFTFETRLAPGFVDSDRRVLQLDYNRSENPAFSVRRVLDEIVQIDDNYYLGKAYLHWLTGKWQLVAYFSLRR